MSTALLLVNAFAAGWMVSRTLINAAERTDDWKPPAKWALLAILNIIGVLILF